VSRSNSPKRKRREKPRETATPAVGFCGPRHKRMYATKSQAKKALRIVNRHRLTSHDAADRAKLEQRVYECPECGFWHLTSQVPRS
jgi:rubrerythrin